MLTSYPKMLHDINDDIARNKNEYHHLFELYSGPQCYEDLFHNPDRMQYDVNYKQHTKRTAAYATPKQDSACEGLLETLENSRFSLRVCDECDTIRILGLRAAKKYPVCFYELPGQNNRQSVKFKCEHLHRISCDNESDIAAVSFDNIEVNEKYILYAEDSDDMFGYLIHTSEIDTEKMYIKYDILQAFGKLGWIHSDVASTADNNWLNRVGTGKWRIGSLTNSGRWKGYDDTPIFRLGKVTIDNPREAVCSQVFYDTQFGDIDHDDRTEQISFGSLLRVRNCHKLLSSLKIIYCAKCRRTLPGIEKFVDGSFIEDRSFSKQIQDIYKTSQVVHTTKMFLDEKFNTSDVYSSNETHVVGVCTECSEYYGIDEDNSVKPVWLDFADSQSESSQVSSQSSSTHKQQGITGINIYGLENLFALDLWSDHHYAAFMHSLTVAEILVITPLLIAILLLRCRATQMPFTKNSSIGFPLKSPMETDELPWTNFRNLPFIKVVYKNGKNGVEKEAKINLQNIVRARNLMTQRFEHKEYPNGRPRYRFVDDGFCTFTNEQMTKLSDELKAEDAEGYSEPMGLREIHMNDETMEDVSKNVPKQQVLNWILSEFPYGNAVHDGCMSDDNMLDSEGNFEMESFWITLKKFIISDLSTKCKDTTADPKKVSK